MQPPSDNPLARLWAWYRRVGPPLEFYTDLAPTDCRQRISRETVGWNNWLPFGVKGYKSRFEKDGRFWVKGRRPGALPFQGRLIASPNGGTLVQGYVVNDLSYLRFLAVVVIVTPIAAGLTYGSAGLMAGLAIGGLFILATLYARVVEENSKAVKMLQRWLREILNATPQVIEGSATKPFE